MLGWWVATARCGRQHAAGEAPLGTLRARSRHCQRQCPCQAAAAAAAAAAAVAVAKVWLGRLLVASPPSWSTECGSARARREAATWPAMEPSPASKAAVCREMSGAQQRKGLKGEEIVPVAATHREGDKPTSSALFWVCIPNEHLPALGLRAPPRQPQRARTRGSRSIWNYGGEPAP